MYHPKKLVNTAPLALLVSLSLNLYWATTAARAEEQKSRSAQVVSSHQVSIESSSYPLIPSRHDCRMRPQDIRIYECDSTPLGNRTPFLLVHGLRGEYYLGFRWDALIRHFQKNDQFSKRFKLYMVRYDSLASLHQTVPLMKAAIADLYANGSKRPIDVMTLSIGGNLVYEAMLDHDIDSKVGLLFTLGTPFHGTPLFCPDWFKYSMYKNFQMPWTRIDHAVAYKLYFRRNPSLLANFGWDNCDNAIPEVGRFSSLLPLGPRGNLTVEGSINKDLLALPDKSFDRKKLIAYSGYLLNPYLLKGRAKHIKSKLMAPYDFYTIELPAHLGREQPVLKMLDRQIAGVRTNQAAANRANTRFVYGLNDGITPLASALFLPSKVCASQCFASETDIAKLKDCVDVRIARVFRNIDHLAFIGGAKPAKEIKGSLRDELNPTAGSHNVFEWMLSDIAQCSEDVSQIAKDEPPVKTPPQD